VTKEIIKDNRQKNQPKKNNSPNNQIKRDAIEHNLILKVFRDIVNRRK